MAPRTAERRIYPTGRQRKRFGAHRALNFSVHSVRSGRCVYYVSRDESVYLGRESQIDRWPSPVKSAYRHVGIARFPVDDKPVYQGICHRFPSGVRLRPMQAKWEAPIAMYKSIVGRFLHLGDSAA